MEKSNVSIQVQKDKTSIVADNHIEQRNPPVIVTFCGHASFDKEKHGNVLPRLLEEIGKGKELHFYLGGYGNFDGYAYACCAAYKQRHPTAELLFVTPYMDEKYLKRRQDDIERYDGILYPEIENVPKRLAIAARNRWMVRQADLVIAYVTLPFGGAANTLEYAKKQRKNYVNLGESR